jgi:hypothetical protein
MADPHVVTALIAKRAEIDGEIERTEKQLRKLRDALEHIDETLRLFAPDAMPELIRPKVRTARADWASHGEQTRRALDILRHANGEKLSTREITLRVMRDRGLDTSRSKLVLAVTRRMNNALRRQRKLGLLESERYHGAWAVWWLAGE